MYGVMSFSVAQRTREVGIRMALGARGSQAVQMVMRSGMEVVIVAVMVGDRGCARGGAISGVAAVQRGRVGSGDDVHGAVDPRVGGVGGVLVAGEAGGAGGSGEYVEE